MYSRIVYVTAHNGSGSTPPQGCSAHFLALPRMPCSGWGLDGCIGEGLSQAAVCEFLTGNKRLLQCCIQLFLRHNHLSASQNWQLSRSVLAIINLNCYCGVDTLPFYCGVGNAASTGCLAITAMQKIPVHSFGQHSPTVSHC